MSNKTKNNSNQSQSGGANDKPRIWMIILLGIVLFFGTGLATSYFNEDVGMLDVQGKLFYYISGEKADEKLMTIAYCAGVALGVIIFFNPFMMGKKGGKPTPMEIKYFEYEQSAMQLRQAQQQQNAQNDQKNQKNKKLQSKQGG